MYKRQALIAAVAAFTATETKDRSLRDIDNLHTTRTEALAIIALDKQGPARG